MQVAAGVIGAQPAPAGGRVPAAASTRQGRLITEEEFGDIIIKTGARRRDDAAQGRRAHRARRGQTTRCAACSTTSRRSRIADLPAPGSNALELSECRRASDGGAEARRSPRASTTRSSTTRPSSCASRSRRWSRRCCEAILLVVIVVIAVPADLARLDHPAAGGAGVARRHVRRHAGVRVLAQQPVAVRPGARHRHRGGRRDRGGRERRAQHRAGLESARRDATRRWRK